jgi:UDP-N-acetylmuramoyl-tripeptide--D-alanyl-D-alanine ligase
MNATFNVSQVLKWLSRAHLVGDAAVSVLRVHTDTRTVEPGDLFVAIKGDRFDANHFLEEARQRGAVAVICHAGGQQNHFPSGLTRIEVPDTKVALAELAKGWRAQFDLPLIAVTGSNGKTTVTQMIASILESQGEAGTALATRGNLNNDIGVPLTVLRLCSRHALAVVELGMNHPGEIANLAAIAQPTVALVNNAQREHLEFMHTVHAVAQENGAVITALGPQGVAVYPLDDEYAPIWSALAGTRRCVKFSLNDVGAPDVLGCVSAQWQQAAWQVKARGLGIDLNYRLAIAGLHNVQNSLAAAACALAAGVPPKTVVLGLESFEPVKGRSKALARQIGGRKFTLVDDTYNANPDSVRAAIDVLAALPAPRLLVLGDMGEVGDQGPEFHAEAARYAHAKGIDQLMLMGELSRGSALEFPGAQHFESHSDLNDALGAVLPLQGSVLVKGSRFMRMERIVEFVSGESTCC